MDEFPEKCPNGLSHPQTKFMTKLQDQNVHSEYENKCAKLRKKQKLSTFLQKYIFGKIPFGKTHLGEKKYIKKYSFRKSPFRKYTFQNTLLENMRL